MKKAKTSTAKTSKISKQHVPKLVLDDIEAKEHGMSYGQYKAVTYWPEQARIRQKQAEMEELRQRQKAEQAAKKKNVKARPTPDLKDQTEPEVEAQEEGA